MTALSDTLRGLPVMAWAESREEIAAVVEAAEHARDTFADTATAAELLRHPTMAEAMRVAECGMDAALSSLAARLDAEEGNG